MFVWNEIRERAVESFRGSTPGNALEAELITIFKRHPQVVSNVIEQTAVEFAEGKLKSPWAIVRLNVNRALEQGGKRQTAGGDGSGEQDHRERAITATEAWIRNAGWQYPQDDFEDELYGRRGKLKRYAADFGLRERMLQLWQELAEAEVEAPDQVPA